MAAARRTKKETSVLHEEYLQCLRRIQKLPKPSLLRPIEGNEPYLQELALRQDIIQLVTSGDYQTAARSLLELDAWRKAVRVAIARFARDDVAEQRKKRRPSQ